MAETPKKTRRKDVYVRMSDRADKGDIELVAPLDFLLLDMMPPEGTIELGVYPQGTTVREMHSRMPNKAVPRTLVTSRIRSLHIQGLITKVKTHKVGEGTGSRSGNTLSQGWQITPRGQEELKKWKEAHANGRS